LHVQKVHRKKAVMETQKDILLTNQKSSFLIKS